MIPVKVRRPLIGPSWTWDGTPFIHSTWKQSLRSD